MAGNKSQIGYMNVPAQNSGEILSQMKEEFQRLGINYHIIDDMRTGDGLLQVMYLKKDEVAVRNWYSNYATDQLLRGGRQEYKDLMNLTNGKTQLVNIPISQDKVEEMLEDFNNLHINYCVMPNLKINDMGTMILYAAADADRVKRLVRDVSGSDHAGQRKTSAANAGNEHGRIYAVFRNAGRRLYKERPRGKDRTVWYLKKKRKSD